MSGPAAGAAPGRLSVRGGYGGIEARADDLDRLGLLLRTTALTVDGQVAHVLAVGLAVGTDGGALLDPPGAARVAVVLAAVTAGPGGLVGLVERAAVTATSVAAAAAAYRAVESVLESALAAAVDGLVRLPAALAAGEVAARRRRPGTGVDGGVVLARDPALADLVGVALAGPAGTAPLGAALGVALPDGHAAVAPRPPDPAVDAAGAPRGIADLVDGLARRNDGAPGDVDVRVLVSHDDAGREVRRAVVDIPGTSTWAVRRGDPVVTDPGTSLHALAGQTTTYEDGVFDALRRAGVAPGDPVLFVGHSQGGMVAVTAARDAAAAGFTAGGVLTAGAPTTPARPPRGVPELALENRSDVVPHLDGRPARADADTTVVTVDHPHDDVAGNHDLRRSYLPGARDVDASTAPDIVAARTRFDGFLDADRVTTSVWSVSRVTP